MKKVELVKAVATETGFTQKDVKTVLEATGKVAYAEMAKQEEVKLFDGLTLMGVFKEAGIARNPLTGESVDVPAKVMPKAKFGKAAKDAVNA